MTALVWFAFGVTVSFWGVLIGAWLIARRARRGRALRWRVMGYTGGTARPW